MPTNKEEGQGIPSHISAFYLVAAWVPSISRNPFLLQIPLLNIHVFLTYFKCPIIEVQMKNFEEQKTSENH